MNENVVQLQNLIETLARRKGQLERQFLACYIELSPTQRAKIDFRIDGGEFA